MLKIAICDDEVYVHEDIKQYLRTCETDRQLKIDCFLNGEELSKVMAMVCRI